MFATNEVAFHASTVVPISAEVAENDTCIIIIQITVQIIQLFVLENSSSAFSAINNLKTRIIK
jgi:hypothetical protein